MSAIDRFTPPDVRHLPLPVLHRGTEYVVVNKPPGLLSIPGRGPDLTDCVQARVAAEFPQASGFLVVHRLDMATSGVMVVALTPDAHRILSSQFERRAVEKRYVALLRGWVTGDGGAISLPQGLDYPNRPRQRVDRAEGKEGITRWEVIDRDRTPEGEARTRIAFTPVTGRTHQLRLQAAHPEGLGCPILGDNLYGPFPEGQRLMLHAHRLVFDEPVGGARVSYEAPVPF